MATPKKIRVGNRTYPVQGAMRIRGRQYLIVRRLSGGSRTRLQAVDPGASPDSEMRCIHLLPHASNLVDRLRPLVRVSQENDVVPSMLEFYPRDKDIAVVCNWIWGTPLHKYLERTEAANGRRLSPYEATRLYCRFVNGLCDLHNRNAVVHGDIKPENLIRTQKSRLVLIDFGAAWTLERMVDYDPNECSSPSYAAPEVLRGGKPTPAGDQFSATAVYYRMLTGQVPYDHIGGQAGAGEGEPSVAFVPPSRFAPRRDGTPRRFWKQIDAIAGRGLQLDPLQRYPSKSDWLDAIDELWIGLKTENRLSGRNRLLVDLIQKAGRLFGRASLLG